MVPRTLLAGLLAAGLFGSVTPPASALVATVADIDNDGDTEIFVNDSGRPWGTWETVFSEDRLRSTPCDPLPDPPKRQCEFVWRRVSTTEAVGTGDVAALIDTFDYDFNGEPDVVVFSSLGGQPFVTADIDFSGDIDIFWVN